MSALLFVIDHFVTYTGFGRMVANPKSTNTYLNEIPT